MRHPELTSVRPEKDIVSRWVASAFKEVKEYVSISNVDISRVGAAKAVK